MCSWKISGLLQRPMGSLRYSYFPNGKTMVQSFLDGGKVERRLSSFKKKPARVVPTDDEEDASMGGNSNNANA